jgi:hypothetical protein
MRLPRAIFLTLTQWLAVVVGGLNGRALVILKNRVDETKHSGLPKAALHAGDIVASSSVLVAALGIAGFTALAIALSLMFKPTRAVPKSLVYLLGFCAVWTLAAQIATTVVATSWKARVSAASYIPQTVIDRIVANSGQKLEYWATPVVRAYTIVGWFAWLALAIAAFLEFKNLGKSAQSTSTFTGSVDADSIDNKPTTSTVEKSTTAQV